MHKSTKESDGSKIIKRRLLRRFGRGLGGRSDFAVDPVDGPESPRQLLPSAASFALVLLQLLRRQLEGALAGLDYERIQGTEDDQVFDDLLAADQFCFGDLDDLVALALRKNREVL